MCIRDSLIYSIKQEDEFGFRASIALLPFVKIRRVAIYAIVLGYILRKYIARFFPEYSRLLGLLIAPTAYILGAHPLAAILASLLVTGALYKAFKQYIEPPLSRKYRRLLLLPIIHLIRVTIVSGTPLGEYYYLITKSGAYREYSYRYIDAVPFFAIFKHYNVIAYLRNSVYFYAPSAALIFYYALRKKPTGVDLFIALALILLAIPMPRNPRHFLRLRALIALVLDDESSKSVGRLYLIGSTIVLILKLGSQIRTLLAMLTMISLLAPLAKIRVRRSYVVGIAILYMRAIYAYAYTPTDGYRYHILSNYFEYVDDILKYNVTGLVYDGAPGLEYFLNASIPAIPLFQPILYEKLRGYLHSYDPRLAFDYLKEHKINAFLYSYAYYGRRTTYKVRYLYDMWNIPYNRILLGPTYAYYKIDRKFSLFLQQSDELIYGFQGFFVIVHEPDYAGAVFDYKGHLLGSPIFSGLSGGKRIELRAIFLGDPGEVKVLLNDTYFKMNVVRIGEFYIATLKAPQGYRVLNGLAYSDGSVRLKFGFYVGEGVAEITLSPLRS